MIDVDEALGGSGAVDAGGTEAGDVEGTAGTLAAAHGEHDGLGLDLHEALRTADDRDELVG